MKITTATTTRQPRDTATSRSYAFHLGKGYWPGRFPRIARARASIVGALMRAAMRRGWVVIVVGRTGSGKTLLLEHATPGRIVDKSYLLMYRAEREAFAMSDVPRGLFSIDEPACFKAGSLLPGLQSLRGRGFAIAFQRASDITHLGLSAELTERHRLITISLNSD